MHAAENQLEEASAAYRTAARFDEANLAPLVHGFAVALLQGDARNARRVAVQLDSLAQYHHSLLSDLSVAMMRDSASWSVHRVAVDRTLGTIETSLGPLSSALAHLIH